MKYPWLEDRRSRNLSTAIVAMGNGDEEMRAVVSVVRIAGTRLRGRWVAVYVDWETREYGVTRAFGTRAGAQSEAEAMLLERYGPKLLDHHGIRRG